MNVDNGNILALSEAIKQSDFLRAYVPVFGEDMTEKQKKNGRVSLKDHRSKLGKQLTGERKQRRNITNTNFTPKKKKRKR